MPLGVDTNSGNPLLGSNFSLDVQGMESTFFTSASGFSNSSEVVEHKMVDGSGMQVTHKIPGEASFDDITLERGITDNMDLWAWRQEILDGNVDSARKDGSIVMYAQDLTEVARWNFIKGWPSAWGGPDVNADGNDVAVESITITIENLTRVL